MTSTTGNTNWGRWGAQDERGALNLATAETILQAAHGLRTGKVYSLGLPISQTRTPKVFDRPAPDRLTRNSPHDQHGAFSSEEPSIGTAEDLIVMPTHSGTHIDALAHVHEGGLHYNGHSFENFTTSRGAGKCSIVRTGSLAARAVLLDVAGLVAGVPSEGVSAPLEAGYMITAADLEECCVTQGVAVGPGDAVLVRTGWTEAHQRDTSTPGYPQAGIGLQAAKWLQDRDTCLVGADNSAVEVMPFDEGRYLCVHAALIVHAGISLIEHLALGEMAADRCYEALLVVGALPIVGATGSPVNPIAIG